ncbi:MAG: recombination protein RecR [Candidatus Sungbacteria bacterium]|nr:recombination protein RecR [Candidatus Sungbacteria bacterium]
MYPKPIQNIIDLFTKFPGIGPRQATRFAFHVLKKPGLAKELAMRLAVLENTIGFCNQCFRTLEQNDSGLTPDELTRGGFCALCRDSKRELSLLAVVEKEADMQNLEKTGSFLGLYHILGGVISPLDQDSPKKLRLRELHERVKKNLITRPENFEVILATNSTAEGDTTAMYIERILSPLKENYPQFKISRLGRGLSLGAELEYADHITLKNALTNRK